MLPYEASMTDRYTASERDVNAIPHHGYTFHMELECTSCNNMIAFSHPCDLAVCHHCDEQYRLEVVNVDE